MGHGGLKGVLPVHAASKDGSGNPGSLAGNDNGPAYHWLRVGRATVRRWLQVTSFQVGCFLWSVWHDRLSDSVAFVRVDWRALSTRTRRISKGAWLEAILLPSNPDFFRADKFLTVGSMIL
jgi:hypothetical protein